MALCGLSSFQYCNQQTDDSTSRYTDSSSPLSPSTQPHSAPCGEQFIQQEASHCRGQEEPPLPQIKEEEEEPGLVQVTEDQEEPEPPQTEDHEGLGTSQKAEQLILKSESENFKVPSPQEQSALTEPQVPEPEQVLSQDSEVHHEKEHLDFPVSKKRAECDETCGETVGTKSSVLVHMRTHTVEKPYLCEACGKSFSQRSNLLTHMRIHSGAKPYLCETCGTSFSARSNFLRHMKIH
uniref:C2H2-type domain-containing protein n=1 Tax=Salarias fasciatus TaxID=181472 RepID=A0A672FV07_SALFA